VSGGCSEGSVSQWPVQEGMPSGALCARSMLASTRSPTLQTELDLQKGVLLTCSTTSASCSSRTSCSAVTVSWAAVTHVNMQGTRLCQAREALNDGSGVGLRLWRATPLGCAADETHGTYARCSAKTVATTHACEDLTHKGMHAMRRSAQLPIGVPQTRRALPASACLLKSMQLNTQPLQATQLAACNKRKSRGAHGKCRLC